MSPHNKQLNDENKKLRAARILVIQANDLLAGLTERYFDVDQSRATDTAKAHILVARKKLDEALSEDV